MLVDPATLNTAHLLSGISRANRQVERVVAKLKSALVMIKNYETVQ